MWIGLSRKVEARRIEEELASLYPGRSVAVLDDLCDLSDNKNEWPDVVATLDYNGSEFPQVVHFTWWPKDSDEPNDFFLAKDWGVKFSCLTIIDGSGYGDDDSPFWSVVYDDNVYYLADDCGSAFGDDEEGNGPVKILRPIQN